LGFSVRGWKITRVHPSKMNANNRFDEQPFIIRLLQLKYYATRFFVLELFHHVRFGMLFIYLLTSRAALFVSNVLFQREKSIRNYIQSNRDGLLIQT